MNTNKLYVRILNYFVILITFSCLLTLSGCDSIFGGNDDNDDKPEENDEPEITYLHEVQGEGTNKYPNNTSENGDFRVSFMATMDADSIISGNVSWENLDGVVQSYGSVYCLDVNNNSVFISYTSEGGEFGGYGAPGNTVLIGFQDNGGNENGTVDKQTFVYFNEAEVECSGFRNFIEAENGPGFAVDWIEGDLVVK